MQASFVSKWNERSISKSLFGMTHPIKFLLMKNIVWKKMLSEEYQDCCLVIGHL